MNYLKKTIKPIIFTTLFILISLFIITLLNYFNILNYKIIIYLKLLLTIIAFFIGGIQIGSRSIKKGWLEGIKFGLIIIVFMTIINIMLDSFEYKALIFYTILLVSSVIGSMLGITKSSVANK